MLTYGSQYTGTLELNYLLVGRQSNGINQSTQHRLLSDCEKCMNYFDIFFFHSHVILYHCVSIIAAFLNTEWLKYNMSFLPLVSSAKRNFKSNRPSAKAASASSAAMASGAVGRSSECCSGRGSGVLVGHCRQLLCCH